VPSYNNYIEKEDTYKVEFAYVLFQEKIKNVIQIIEELNPKTYVKSDLSNPIYLKK